MSLISKKDPIRSAIRDLVLKKDLGYERVSDLMQHIIEKKATQVQIAGFLTALTIKGEKADEIRAAVDILRSCSEKIKIDQDNLVDLCGTGSDKSNSFNISTTAAFVVAGAGIKVAKHGNVAASSSSGSADLLRELGVNLDASFSLVKRSIEEIGIGFLFAPRYHKALGNVKDIRRELGIETIFNILGPLLNPVFAKRQLIGVFNNRYAKPMAEVLKDLGSESVYIAHGEDGLDEVTITGKSFITELKDGKIKSYLFDPSDLNIKKGSLASIKGSDSLTNAKITLSILKNEEKKEKRDIVLLNSMFAIMASGRTDSQDEAYAIGLESIESGKAFEKLQQLKKVSNGK